MTVLNDAAYISHAIDSIIGQSFPDWELIIWDDGSTDDSKAIANHYAQKDHRIKVVGGHRIGRPAALIAVAALASGQYIGFVDADDLLAPDALQLTIDYLIILPNCGMVYSDYLDMTQEGEVLGLGHRCLIPYSCERLLIDFITFQFRLIRREIYDLVGGVDPSFPCAQDYDLCLKIAEITNIGHLPEPLYFYRKNPNGISQTRRITQIECSARAVRDALVRRGLACSLDVSPTGQFRLFKHHVSAY
jgi:glycosyltransferase involved in cell wall biosynthesis